MAKEFKVPKGKEVPFGKSGAPQGKYPWDEWLDGRIMLIERDELNDDGTVKHKRDFDVEVDAMPGKLKFAGRRRYKVVEISRRDPDGKRLKDALLIRARDMTDAERAEEDAERVKDAAKAKDRRAKEKAAKDAEANGATAPATGPTPAAAAAPPA